ncbi:peptidoglycan D,D-transpeptidase FtsI family protein [Deinococcus yavapaiensis]|uniref:peptidoglycan D,D-transpeptidase FtsI family protein n=1 Tax=Deinococcus yavapaiensis TaxID=309889 RepID=UPI0011B5E689
MKIRNRSRLMLVLALGAFLLLVYAYAQLEWRLPQARTAITTVLRGNIVAADGTVLATSRDVTDLIYKGGPVKRWADIRAASGLTASKPPSLAPREEMTLAARLTDAQVDRLRDLARGQPNLELRPRVERVYPLGTVAGQLLGMMGRDAGLEGIERFYDARLAQGEDVVLTIDPRFQAVAESVLGKYVREHEGVYGSVVALDVATGRVLASASYPEFDPNVWSKYDAAHRRNRPMMDTFEPGSTVKALSVAAALNEGLTNLDIAYDTPMTRKVAYKSGINRISYKTIHDAVARPKGVTTLTVKGILRYSSNVGMSHVVEHFPYAKLHTYLKNFGFGGHVDLGGVYAENGRLSDPRTWDDVVRVNNSFGQGLSASPLQLALAYNTLANGGVFVSPQLVIGEPQGPTRRVIKQDVAKTTLELLRSVVSEGIPHAAGIEGYDLGGKTGTAQTVVNGRYSGSIFDSVFAGIFPTKAPRVTVAVMVHGAKHDYHGSMLAAPIFRDIASEVYSQWAYPPSAPSPEQP